MGKDGAVYLMGWTGGYVLLALLLAPYLRKFGHTLSRFYWHKILFKNSALVLFVFDFHFFYLCCRSNGGLVSFFLDFRSEINVGVIIGMIVVFFYAVLGGMKGITYTQVAQYCVMIFAYLVPAIFISILITGNPIPQLGIWRYLVNSSTYLLISLINCLLT